MVGILLDIIIILFFSITAFKIFLSVKREKEIFMEFNQSRIFSWLSLLFPLGPIAYLTTVYRLGWVPALILMALCYLPALIASKKAIVVFNKSGTDRVNNAKNAVEKSHITAIAGLLYVGILLIMALSANVIT